MQLKRPASNVRQGLIAASCALLSATGSRAADAPAPPAADAGAGSNVPLDEFDSVRTFDAALGYYHEGGGLVSGVEPVVDLKAELTDNEVLHMRLSIDSLSGATPNGALPSRYAQTFAFASGHSLNGSVSTFTSASGQQYTAVSNIYEVNPGQRPLDPHYHDTRVAALGDWTLPVTTDGRATFGGNLSFERDFLSVSGNATWAQDLNQKNTTLTAGVNAELDAVHPIGGTPLPASDYSLFLRTGHQSKHDLNLLVGATQVMARRWIAEVNASIDRDQGYLNDPYKIITILNNDGSVKGYLNEKRPESRTRESVFLENRFATDRTMVALSLRYMHDDWGIHSETAQLRWRLWSPARSNYLEPQLRWYQQSAARFFTPWLDASGGYVNDASSDLRLAAFRATTIGLKYAHLMPNAADLAPSELSVRLESYNQSFTAKRANPNGLEGLNLYPSLQAIQLLFEWKFQY